MLFKQSIDARDERRDAGAFQLDGVGDVLEIDSGIRTLDRADKVRPGRQQLVFVNVVNLIIEGEGACVVLSELPCLVQIRLEAQNLRKPPLEALPARMEGRCYTLLVVRPDEPYVHLLVWIDRPLHREAEALNVLINAHIEELDIGRAANGFFDEVAFWEYIADPLEGPPCVSNSEQMPRMQLDESTAECSPIALDAHRDIVRVSLSVNAQQLSYCCKLFLIEMLQRGFIIEIVERTSFPAV